MARDFEQLVHEASVAPADTWDFGWLAGRAVEERPSWRYFDLVRGRLGGVRRLLDLDTGTADLLHALPELPPLTVATDAHRPSIRLAAPRLHACRAHLVQTGRERPALPFRGDTFDLIISRHPIDTAWAEVARVLAPGGRYVSQQVGPHSLRDLAEFLMGPRPASTHRDPELARWSAEAAGLVVEDLRVERTRVAFFDIGAVVYFLRVVIWTVPDFTVDRYRSQLLRLHEHIESTGVFETTSSRFLIDARRPAGTAPLGNTSSVRTAWS